MNTVLLVVSFSKLEMSVYHTRPVVTLDVKRTEVLVVYLTKEGTTISVPTILSTLKPLSALALLA